MVAPPLALIQVHCATAKSLAGVHLTLSCIAAVTLGAVTGSSTGNTTEPVVEPALNWHDANASPAAHPSVAAMMQAPVAVRVIAGILPSHFIGIDIT